jgi:desulfoferrodoxin (superoxide reductase-like protein)
MIPKDIAGNEIHDGAILKVYHFTEAHGKNGRRHYMYKQVFKVKNGFVQVSHLPIKDKPTSDYNNKGDMTDSLVVACYCDYHIHNNLKRKVGF